MLGPGKPGIHLSVSGSPVGCLCCDGHSISLGMNRGLKEGEKEEKDQKNQPKHPGPPPCHLLTGKWPVQRKIYSNPESGQTPNFSGNTSWDRVPSITS